MTELLPDVRKDPKMLDALRRIAPGTTMRQGLNDVLRARLGALIVIGEPAELSFMFSGGIRLDQAFSPYLLYELAKMDGAIILNAVATRIVYANVQLMPDPTIPSAETGTRHRTAERVAKQTGALVISISQQRDVVTTYVGDVRYQLEDISDILAKTNQAVTTLETYRTRFEQVSTRLTALEFQGAAMLDDVLVALQRAEMTSRMRDEIERNIAELGVEGRLIKIQLDEMSEWVPGDEVAMVRDYELPEVTGGYRRALDQLRTMPDTQLLELEQLAEVLGYPRSVSPVDYAVTPRGHRVLSKIPRLPESVITHVVEHFDGLEAFVRASQAELEEVEGVGAVRAREIREGLRRLQEQNLVDRYLNL
jgi:diadenylate cyclase